ncbi:MAG TPA: glycerate kinase [Solirubrobacterales bacterium]|nr:glycerate kinase [Solirubrobacterales bacterium]
MPGLLQGDIRGGRGGGGDRRGARGGRRRGRPLSGRRWRRGTAETVRVALGGEVRTAPAHDPLGRPIEAAFALVEDGETAVVDTAAASGLPLVEAAARDAEGASTYGTGELIAAAVAAGARRVLLAAGAAPPPTAASARSRRCASAAVSAGHRWAVLCDVRTTFEDSARIFGPQKGADPAAVGRLTERLERVAGELPRDPRGVPMSGAAGGLSGGLWAAFDADLQPGAEFVLDLLDFDRRLHACEAAIGGEGRIDAQSLEGKVVGRIAARCAAARDLHVIVGQDALDRTVVGTLPIRSIREAGTLTAIRTAAHEIATSPGP